MDRLDAYTIATAQYKRLKIFISESGVAYSGVYYTGRFEFAGPSQHGWVDFERGIMVAMTFRTFRKDYETIRRRCFRIEQQEAP
jgi:hypothetical protein